MQSNKTFFCFLFFLFSFLCWSAFFAPSGMAAWTAQVNELVHAPEQLAVVDKANKRFYLFGLTKDLQNLFETTCIVGREAGDKAVRGDLKTPEGVYFVESHITKGLNEEKYGGVAYTLNYPNPIDRLRGKTGYGIWLHSRGPVYAPDATEGCIAISKADIAQVGPHFVWGTPLVIAEKAQFVPNKAVIGSETHQTVAILTQKWVEAWAACSPEFFELYNPDAYTKSQGVSFTAFKQQKESLFARFKSIDTYAVNIKVLEGTDYWVSWFDQYYKAPNLATQGIRRLYWQKDEKGMLRVVGMEWFPRNIGLKPSPATGKPPVIVAAKPVENPAIAPRPIEIVKPAEIVKPVEVSKPVEIAKPTVKVLPEKEITALLTEWKAAWLAANVEEYKTFYTGDAIQDSRKGNSIFRNKATVWETRLPKEIEFTNITLQFKNDTIVVTFNQRYTDSTGYSDYGKKTLVLVQHQGSWKIFKETWRR